MVKTAPRAFAYALSLVNNRADAEDVVHDCFRRLIEKSDKYDLLRDGTKLLFRSVTNACINLTQRRPPTIELSSGRESGVELHDKSHHQPDQRVLDREFENIIAEMLEKLPVKQRAVIELKSFGYSLAEIAELLDLSPVNARVLLSRARKALAARLQPYLEESLK